MSNVEIEPVEGHVNDFSGGLLEDDAPIEVNMDEFIGKVAPQSQARLIKINGEVYRLMPKLSAIGMAKISKGVNEENFDEILNGTIRLFHKDSRANFVEWLEDEEPDMETVMSVMEKAMEIITGKGSTTS